MIKMNKEDALNIVFWMGITFFSTFFLGTFMLWLKYGDLLFFAWNCPDAKILCVEYNLTSQKCTRWVCYEDFKDMFTNVTNEDIAKYLATGDPNYLNKYDRIYALNRLLTAWESAVREYGS